DVGRHLDAGAVVRGRIGVLLFGEGAASAAERLLRLRLGRDDLEDAAGEAVGAVPELVDLLVERGDDLRVGHGAPAPLELLDSGLGLAGQRPRERELLDRRIAVPADGDHAAPERHGEPELVIAKAVVRRLTQKIGEVAGVSNRCNGAHPHYNGEPLPPCHGTSLTHRSSGKIVAPLRTIILERNRLVARRIARIWGATGLSPVCIEDPKDLAEALPQAELLVADVFDGDVVRA